MVSNLDEGSTKFKFCLYSSGTVQTEMFIPGTVNKCDFSSTNCVGVMKLCPK